MHFPLVFLRQNKKLFQYAVQLVVRVLFVNSAGRLLMSVSLREQTSNLVNSTRKLLKSGIFQKL